MYEYSGHEEQDRQYHVALRKYMFDRLQNELDFLMAYFRQSVSETYILNRIRDEILTTKDKLKSMEIDGLR